MSRTLGCASKPSIVSALGFTGYTGPANPTGKQVSEYGVTNRVWSSARSDHGDGAGRQQLGDRACLGGVFTLGVRVEPVLGAREIEGDFNDPNLYS